MSVKPKISFLDACHIVQDKWNALITGNQYKVVSVILRKTYGSKKTIKKITHSQFQKFTGLARSTVIKALNDLIEMGIVGKLKAGENGVQECRYYLIFDEEHKV